MVVLEGWEGGRKKGTYVIETWTEKSYNDQVENCTLSLLEAEAGRDTQWIM